jgi:ribosomal protein S27E
MVHAAITDRSPHSPPYQRHRPERTRLYQIIERYYPEFRDVMAMQSKPLPLHVEQEFDDYLKCGRLEHGFLRVQCTHCHHEHLVAFSCKRRGFCPSCGASRMAESAALLVDEVLPEQPIRQWVLSFPFQLRFLLASRPQLMGRVLGIVCRAISSHLIQKAGFTRKTAQTGAVTLIQRFGSALNLNVHFHLLFLDGVYTTTPWGKSRFHRTNAPDRQELRELVHRISHRVAGYLERQGILERDEDNSYLNLEEGAEDPMQQVLGCSVSYRIAIGPQQGRKIFTLQTIPAWEEDDRFAQVAKVAGFSLHAGVAAQAWERQKLERLCRYITRPAVSEKRLSLTPSGNIRYDVNGITSVAGAWMRRSDPAQNALQRWDHARDL